MPKSKNFLRLFLTIAFNLSVTAVHPGEYPHFEKVAELAVSGTAEKIWVNDDLAFLTAEGEGLILIDITDPSHPVRLGTYDGGGEAVGLSEDGETLFTENEILDISDPSAPTFIASYPESILISAVSGSLVYGVTNNYIAVIDVSDRNHPMVIGSGSRKGGGLKTTTTYSTWLSNLVFHEDRLIHVKNYGNFSDYQHQHLLYETDVTNPAGTLIGKQIANLYQHEAGRIEIVQNRLIGWATVLASSMVIFDFDKKVSSSIGLYPRAVAGPSQNLFVLPERSEVPLTVVDLTIFPDIQKISETNLGEARDLDFANDLLYVAHAEAGLLILEYQDPRILDADSRADINEDGIVDGKDLSILMHEMKNAE
ncbi:MAG: hypothetical protein KC931_10995 [Candidatus Omnitrophica bacterium]|nr:hypothetical protein [Candidatus Omnitrophota bacterium]